ncbi:hypothetical protein BGX26_007589 [Mortierella sp. AD094]|nr:hypothetical protein BGX26_007589 [Mortierella sp. AD094]
MESATTTHKALKLKRLLSLAAACCIVLSFATAKPVSRRSDDSKIKNYVGYESIVGSDSMMPTFIDHRDIKKPAPTKRSDANQKVNNNIKGAGSAKTAGSQLGKTLSKAKNILQNVIGGSKTSNSAKRSFDSIDMDKREMESKEKSSPPQDRNDNHKESKPPLNQQTESTTENSEPETIKEHAVESPSTNDSPTEPLANDAVDTASTERSAEEPSVIETVSPDSTITGVPATETVSTKDTHAEPPLTSEPESIKISSAEPHDASAIVEPVVLVPETPAVEETLAPIVEKTLAPIVEETPISDTNESTHSPTANTETKEHAEELSKRSAVIYINNQAYEEVDDEGDITSFAWQSNNHNNQNHDDDDIVTRYLHRDPKVPDPELDKYGHRGCNNSAHRKSPPSSPSDSVWFKTLSCFGVVLLLLISLLIVVSVRLYDRRRETSPFAFFSYLTFGIFASPFKDASALSGSTVTSFSKTRSAVGRGGLLHDCMDADMYIGEKNYEEEEEEEDSRMAESTSFSKTGQFNSDLRRTSTSQHHIQEDAKARDIHHRH